MNARRLVLLALGLLLLTAFAAAPDVVTLTPAEKHPPKLPVAHFSHGEHKGMGCWECHPGLFSKPRPRITHDEMKRGQYCGACHDGRLAKTPAQLGCASCHAK